MLVIRLPKVTSTQDFAFAIHGKLNEDFVVVAEEQTKARGRFGRSWYSPKGGLWFTLVKKGVKVESIPLLPLASSLAVRHALSDYVDGRIRWPNDVVVRDLKIAGILVDAEILGNSTSALIGVGINVNVKDLPEDLGATSLYREIGREVELEKLLNSVINLISRYMDLNSSSLIKEVNDFLSLRGSRVRLSTTSGEFVCIVEEVDFQGRLKTSCGLFAAEDVVRVVKL